MVLLPVVSGWICHSPVIFSFMLLCWEATGSRALLSEQRETWLRLCGSWQCRLSLLSCSLLSRGNYHLPEWWQNCRHMVLLHLSVSGAARALPAVSQALGARPWSQSLSASQEETGGFSPHGSRQEALMVPFIRRRLPFFHAKFTGSGSLSG